MEISDLIPHVEALIFASDKPLTTLEITELVNNVIDDEKISLDQVENAIESVVEKYTEAVKEKIDSFRNFVVDQDSLSEYLVQSLALDPCIEKEKL